MGDMAEYYMDIAMQQEWEFEAEQEAIRRVVDEMERKYMLGSLKWETKDNGKILVSKMSEEHIKNVINFIGKDTKSEVLNKWIELLSIELEKR